MLTFPTLQTTFDNVSHVYSTIKNKCNLWHQRLDHPSKDTMLHINKIFPTPDVSNFPNPFDFCLYAKQKWLPFPGRTTITKHYFEPIHMDI